MTARDDATVEAYVVVVAGTAHFGPFDSVERAQAWVHHPHRTVQVRDQFRIVPMFGGIWLDEAYDDGEPVVVGPETEFECDEATEVTVAGQTSIHWGLAYDGLGALRAKHYPRYVHAEPIRALDPDLGGLPGYPGTYGLAS